MQFALMITGPAYGTQQASSALQFAQTVLTLGHKLVNVFFYLEGVYNANQFTTPASDEYNLVHAWKMLYENHGVGLHACLTSALRRGIVNISEAERLSLPAANLQSGFTLSGLGTLAQTMLTCNRMIQF